MSANAVEVRGLSKRYALDRSSKGSRNFREMLGDLARSPFERIRKLQGAGRTQEDFWALRDVSFDIPAGAVAGIIGRNGAGKSTLLKILSRIAEPTEGAAVLRGRVASLLEVGTGFHPELSGRENIYLNGAILGMRRREIEKKFSQIVEFAEVERFLDTPVKRYSSGMYVRLAFAVAAHLEPEILIVDEVLAVGDAEFQRRCLGKMQEVSRSGGRTVLFVSHNMAAVRALCTTGIVLSGGRLHQVGDVASCVAEYLKGTREAQTSAFRSQHGLILRRAEMVPADSPDGTRPLFFNEPCQLRVRLESEQRFSNAGVVVRIQDDLGTLVTTLCTPEEGMNPFELHREREIAFRIPRMTLMPGTYTISVYVFRPGDETAYLEADPAAKFEVLPAIVNGGMWPYQRSHGVVRLADGLIETG